MAAAITVARAAPSCPTSARTIPGTMAVVPGKITPPRTPGKETGNPPLGNSWAAETGVCLRLYVPRLQPGEGTWQKTIV
ncbi:hypothetical protein ACFX15_023264 [Malus domestica]